MDYQRPTPTVSPLLLDRYRIDGTLGVGALGIVYRAYDLCLNRTVAIKMLKRGLAATQPAHFHLLEERFVREAQVGSSVGDHRNLVDTYDLVTDAQGTLSLILEYVSGGTFAGRIAQSSIPLADALRLTADAARGLYAAHDKGLVHCDVKPANIFLAQDGRAQVGDFGSAHIEGISGAGGAPATNDRTPLYMSPEQRNRTEEPHPATDQYSLGLVLYEMVTGRMYKGMTSREAETLLDEIPEPVVTLFHRMSAENPADRFRSMVDVVREVTQVERELAAA